jgi:hypothetical protein
LFTLSLHTSPPSPHFPSFLFLSSCPLIFIT